LGVSPAPFYHGVESPYEDFDDDFTRLRACEITLDRSRSTAAWGVDGHTVYQTHGTFIPERVGIGFGIWTMLPHACAPGSVSGRCSRSGKVAVARWTGRAWTHAGAGSVYAGSAPEPPGPAPWRSWVVALPAPGETG